MFHIHLSIPHPDSERSETVTVIKNSPTAQLFKLFELNDITFMQDIFKQSLQNR